MSASCRQFKLINIKKQYRQKKFAPFLKTEFDTEAKLRFANTSDEDAKKSSKQAKQREIRKRFLKKQIEKICYDKEYHVLTSSL